MSIGMNWELTLVIIVIYNIGHHNSKINATITFYISLIMPKINE